MISSAARSVAPPTLPAGDPETELDQPRREWWRPATERGMAPAPIGEIAPERAGGRIPVLALLACLVVMILAPQSWIPALAPFRLAFVTAGIAIAAHVLDCLFHGRPITIVTREIVLAACLAGWAFLTVPLATWPGGSLSFLLGVFLKSLAIFWLIANLVRTPGRFRALSLTLTIISVPLASVAVSHFMSGQVTAGGELSHGVKRIVGYEAPLTENPNDLALMLNLLLPFAIANLVRARGPAARGLLMGVVVLDAAAVVLTFSRAGFLTLALTLSLYVFTFLKGKGRGWAVGLAFLALLAVPFLPGSYLSHMGTITDINSDRSGSAQARWAGMVTAAKLTLLHPIIGAGAGMDVLALNQAHGETWKEVHNVYLEYAVDLGLPGLGLFVALLGSCMASARRTRRAAEAPGREDLRQHALALSVCLCAYSLAAMFHPVGYHPYFYIIAGLTVALATIRNSEALPVTH